MNISGKVRYWLDLADYDFETARVMLRGGRYLYVGFMCHQTIEKALKGYYVFALSEIPPFTHNLTVLARGSGLLPAISDDHRDFMDLLEPLNVEARYPTAKDRLLKVLTRDRCIWILDQTEALLEWIKTRL